MLKKYFFALLLGLSITSTFFANNDLQRSPQAENQMSWFLSFQEDDFALGNKAFDNKDYELAIFYFTRYIGKNSNVQGAYYNRGLAYNVLKKYDLALVDFAKVIEINPQYWQAYSGRGFSYYELRNYEAAIREYTLAIQINPNDHISYKNRGLAYQVLGKTDLAQADTKKAEQIRAGNAQGTAGTSAPKGTEEDFQAGSKALENKDYANAIIYLTRYLNTFPNKSGAYYNRGLANYYLQKYESALADYGKSIELDPKFVNTYINRGLVHLNIKDYEKAIGDFSTAIKLDPNNKLAYQNRSFTYKTIGRNDLADADLAIIARLEGKSTPPPNTTNTTNTTNTVAANNLTPQQTLEVGIYAFENEKYDQAVFFLGKYLQSFPNNKGAYYIRGLANRRLNNLDYAIADYNKTLELDPNYVDAYVSRGFVFATKRNYELAMKDYNAAIKLDPNNEQAYINRAVAYKETGKIKQSEEDFAKADNIAIAKSEAKLAKLVPLSPNSKGISWTPVVEMDKQIFPSYFLARATIPIEESKGLTVLGDNHGIVGLHIANPKPNSKITIGVQLDPVIGYQEFEYNLPVQGRRYRIFPKIVWNWDALKKYKRPSPANATFTLSINGEQIEKKTVVVRIRSINEAVYAYRFLDNENWANTGTMFAAYVNEDHEWIDTLLKEALETRLVDSFSGYQRGAKGVAEQVFAIWYLLQRRGFKYSSITDTSGANNLVYSQYVRLFDEAIKVSQANCVDGTVLFASILKKIGINVGLVLIPGHCFLVFDMDGKGDLWGLETTAIGLIDLRDYADKDKVAASYDVFKKALGSGNKQLQESLPKINAKQPQYNLISVNKARKDGINPVDWEAK